MAYALNAQKRHCLESRCNPRPPPPPQKKKQKKTKKKKKKQQQQQQQKKNSTFLGRLLVVPI